MNKNKNEHMKELRIVFMGTPDFAVATLAKLVENEYTIAGVLTAPDRPAGRGRKLHQSAVKKYAIEQGLTVLQPTNLKNADFLATLKKLGANLQIVVAFRMLPKVVWDMPQYGTFNLHASLLPNYRGAAPINWAIINGESKTGVTTFYIDDRIDTGEVIIQESATISEDDSAGSLHDKLMDLGADLVLKTVRQIENGIVTTSKQKDAKDLKSANKINKETCQVDWSKSLDEIYNHIRGLSPYPASWSVLTNGSEALSVKIYVVAKEYSGHHLKNGTLVFDKKEIKVAVKSGFINLLEIQLPGKRRMHTSAVLNGLKLEKNAFFS